MKNKGVSVVVAAAGTGKRMNAGKNKQFLNIDGLPVLVRTLKVFSEWKMTAEIIIVAKEDEVCEIKNLVEQNRINKVKKIICGGATRQKSVFNGIKEASEEYVFIHDGARPFVEQNCLFDLLEAVEKKGAAALGIVPKDTVAVVDDDGFLEASPKRTCLRNMQTPQAFKTAEILKAHNSAEEQKLEFTDDCSLYSAQGGKVFIVCGSEDNIKITVPEDLIVAEKIAMMRKKVNNERKF